MKKYFLVFSFLLSSICANSVAGDWDARVLIYNVQGVILSQGHSYIPDYVFEKVKGAVCYDCLSEIAEGRRLQLLSQIEEALCGRTITARNAKYLERKLQALFRRENYPMCRIEFTPQGKVLLVHITPLRLGEVVVEGARSKNYVFLEHVHLEQGEAVSEQQLLEDVHWLNKNPFHDVQATCIAQKNSDRVDVSLSVKEERPLRVQLSANNIQSDVYNPANQMVSLELGNLWNRRQSLSYRMLYGYGSELYCDHEVKLMATLPNRNFLRGSFRQYSLTTDGFSSEMSAEYDVFCAPKLHGEQALRIGVHNLWTNLNWRDAEVVVEPEGVQLWQVDVLYAAKYAHQGLGIEMGSHAWLQVGAAGPLQIYRDGTQRQYVITQPFTHVSYHSQHRGSIQVHARGQWASSPLIAYEQFSLGGVFSVRGYPQKSHLVDHAAVVNAEYTMPAIHLQRGTRYGTIKAAMNPKCYFDLGWGWNYFDPVQEPSEQLASLGMGVNLCIQEYIQCQLEAAIPLISEEKQMKGYFSLQGTF